MPSTHKSQLSPALVEILQACVHLRTTNAKLIVDHLGRAETTIRSEFQTILKRLDAVDRAGALVIAIENGWVLLRDAHPAYPNIEGDQ